MPKLIPVEGNPFESGSRLMPVDGNPFAQGAQQPEGQVSVFTPPEGYPSDPQEQRARLQEAIAGYPQPVVDTLKASAKNIPASGAKFGQDIYAALRHPVETAKGAASVAAGFGEKFIPGEQAHEPAFDALLQVFADRYGSAEQFKNTLVEDPVGVAADLSALFFGTGAALRGAGAISRSTEISRAGKLATAAGQVADPLNVAAKGISRAVKAVTPEGLPAKLYESAAKFSTTLPESQRLKMAETALDAGIMPTAAGVGKTRGMIDTLNSEIVRIIDSATETGKKIDVESMFQYLDEVRKDAILTGTPIANLKAIDRIENQIRSLNKMLDRKQLTPSEAQRIKQNIYKDVTYASGKEKVRYAEESQKAIARAVKEEIERIHPEIKNLNSKEGALIDLLKHIERSASRIGNRDILGIGTPIKGTLGGVIGGVEGAVAGIVSGVLDSPSVKAKLAIVLRKAQKSGGSVPGAQLRAVTYQAGKVGTGGSAENIAPATQ